MRLIKYLDRGSSASAKFLIFVNRPEIKKEIQEIRKKYNIIPSEDLPADEYLKFAESEAINSDVKALIKKLKLHEEWGEFTINFIITNDLFYNRDPDSMWLEQELKDGADNEFFLRLTPTTSLNDVKKAWPIISKIVKGDKKSKRKPLKKYWRDYTVYRLFNEGKKIADVLHAIKQEFNEDLDYSNIKRIDSEFRKRIGEEGPPKKDRLKIS